MLKPDDIHSLTDFKRRTADHVRAMRKSGRPRVLTVNGRAELVVADARAFGALLEALEKAEATAGILEGRRDAAAGRARPAAEVLREVRRSLRRRKAS